MDSSSLHNQPSLHSSAYSPPGVQVLPGQLQRLWAHRRYEVQFPLEQSLSSTQPSPSLLASFSSSPITRQPHVSRQISELESARLETRSAAFIVTWFKQIACRGDAAQRAPWARREVAVSSCAARLVRRARVPVAQ